MDVKSIFASKTFWGAVVTLASQFLPNVFVWLGVEPNAVVDHIVGGIGFAVAVYGRYVASKQVSLAGK